MPKVQKLAPLLLVIIALAFLMSFYSDILTNPNGYLFSDNGDAIKNYYTYAGHIKDNTYIHSNIMNYPYGENFLYLDCHPIFTVLLKPIVHLFPAFSGYSIGIINFLMIFSLVITALFIYLILRTFKVDHLFAVISAFSIAVLAPQIFRTFGHYAMAYSFFIPLTWYIYIRFTLSGNKLKWSLLMLVNNLFWYFTHGYVGMIAVAFVFLCFAFDFLFFERLKYKMWKHWLYLLLQTVVPLVAFWLFTHLTDIHIGRKDNPEGILIATANAYSVFLPNHAPLKPILDAMLKTSTHWEGWAYIGIGSSIMFVLFLINRLLRLFKIGSIANDKALLSNHVLIVAFCASVILLLFSMGYPFKWNMEFLLDWFPVLNKFRAIGRFAWVFYYVITISSVYFGYLIYTTRKPRFVWLILILLLPFSYIWEGVAHHADVSNNITKIPNLFNHSQLSEEFIEGLQYTDSSIYQALIPLPYYYLGTEDYKKLGTKKIFKLSMILSYHSGLPLLSNYATHSSIFESKNLVQVLSPNYYDKEILKDIHSNKPFIVLYSNEPLSEYEALILDRCNKIYQGSDYSLYSITKQSLLENNSNNELLKFEKLKQDLSENQGFLTLPQDDQTAVIYNTFEDSPMAISHRGKGSYKGNLSKYNLLVKIEPLRLENDKEYVASFWMYNEGENYGHDALISTAFMQSDDGLGNLEWLSQTNPARSVVIDGSWSLVELNFKVKDNKRLHALYIKCFNDIDRDFYVDDILIREKGVDLYKVEYRDKHQVQELIKNNHRIKFRDGQLAAGVQ